MVAGALLFAMMRLFLPVAGNDRWRRPPAWAFIIGRAGIELFPGLVGVGWGIFLTLLILFRRSAEPKTVAAISPSFILGSLK